MRKICSALILLERTKAIVYLIWCIRMISQGLSQMLLWCNWSQYWLRAFIISRLNYVTHVFTAGKLITSIIRNYSFSLISLFILQLRSIFSILLKIISAEIIIEKEATIVKVPHSPTLYKQIVNYLYLRFFSIQ